MYANVWPLFLGLEQARFNGRMMKIDVSRKLGLNYYFQRVFLLNSTKGLNGDGLLLRLSLA